MLDAMSGVTRFLWVRNGTVDVAGDDDEIGILMDIGALDIKERAARPGTKAIVLTEDQNTRLRKTLLVSSGFDLSTTAVLSYYGVSTLKQLRPLVQVIQASNPKAKIVVHRDRDYMTDQEVGEWEDKIRQLHIEPFPMAGVDLESHFLDAKHLATVNDKGSIADFEDLILTAQAATKEKSTRHYVNGRIQFERSRGTQARIDHGKLAVEAATAVENDLVGNSHGKTVLKRLRTEFRTRYGTELQIVRPSEHIAVGKLQTISKKVFKSQAQQ
jgi:hypothetical protein